MQTSKPALDNTFIVLIGFAGTGKYTIGRELCQRTGAALIDNHLINNPIFRVVNADGVTPLPKGVWDKVKQVRRTVYDAIREHSPPHLSFVFTIELRESDPSAHKAFLELEQLAAERSSLLVPVRLICDVEELCRRVSSPERAEMLKEISPELARRKSAEHTVLNPTHENTRTIDVTHKTPSESADAILLEVELLSSGSQ
ncbi:MAG: chloramphenicol phosphotransferase, partial [Acidobacteria bacterium]|nr:chloramphenicol phosphotransferase [Acidobacteriota bacterium]